ncbi:NAD(P)/FAD-dependent oxidoreductase [Mycobacterium sp. NPDC003449]
MPHSVVIVGAGVIGSSLAYEFARRGSDVTVVDSAAVASVTSSATFAWVNANNKTPQTYADLNLEGLRAHERARDRRALGSADWFHQSGNVQIAQTSEEIEALEAKVRQLSSTGYDVSLLSAEQVRDLEPSLRSATLRGGALFPSEGWVDTLTMCTSLLNGARTRGARFLPFHTVDRVDTDGVHATSIDGTRQRFHADTTILAAGNGNRAILAATGAELPVIDPGVATTAHGSARSTVGLVSTTAPVESGISHIVRATGIAIRPARNGGVTFTDHPTGSQWDLDDPRIWTIPDILLRRARELYPSLDNAFTETVQLGTRVMPEDGMTIADWAGDNRAVYVVATHSGVTLSVFLAESVADEVLDGNRHPALTSFGLARFSTP